MSIVEAEIIDDEVTEVSSGNALAVLQSAEIDIQISTAKRYPRSVTAFKRKALEMATLDEETAGSMFYVLPRSGKKIEGPSVRLAEIVGSCWGNIRYASRIIATEERFVTAQGMCFDLETNTSAAIEVKRRITDKHGKRYNDDMIQVTSQAACSIALREAIFKVVPRAYVNPICAQAKLTSIGKAESMGEKRTKMLDWFKKTGATEKMLLDFLGHKGIEDVTVDDLITLRGIATAIKDGEVTIETALAADDSTAPAQSKVKKSKLGEEEGGAEAEGQPASEKKEEPKSADEMAADLVSFIERCDKAVTIQEVHEADGALRGENGRQLTDAETEVADKSMAAAMKRIRESRGERSNKQKELAG